VLKDHDVEAAGVGRRVFIKGLAATGALVGGLAVGGPASAQEASGAPARARGHQEGLLWVNHEYPDPFFIHGNANPETKTASQIELEQYAVGGAVIRVVRRGDGPWELKRDRRYARRITATSPRIKLTGAGVGDPGNPDVWAPVPDHTYGSLANCAGGITPWGTALSAEENWDDYAEDYGWGPDFAAVNNGGYGWVLEVDPMDSDWVPRKHTNLGRVRAENATVWARQGRHLVVYVGDDARDKFLYKYISDGRYHKADGRRNSRLLADGQLWVAEFAPASQDETVLSGTGRWHKVDMTLVRRRRRGPRPGTGQGLLLSRQPGVRPARQPLDGHRHLLQRAQRPDQPVRLPPQQRDLHDPGRRARRRPGVPVRLGAQRVRVDRPDLVTRAGHHVPVHPAPGRGDLGQGRRLRPAGHLHLVLAAGQQDHRHEPERAAALGDRRPPLVSAAVELVRRFVEAYNAAAAGDRGRLGSVATPEAVAGYLVESHSGVVAPLASRTGVPDGASLEVDPARASKPFPGLVVVPFQGHGFPRPDFVGEAELHLVAGKVARVVFRAP
jgi:hypothetical protein